MAPLETSITHFAAGKFAWLKGWSLEVRECHQLARACRKAAYVSSRQLGIAWFRNGVLELPARAWRKIYLLDWIFIKYRALLNLYDASNMRAHQILFVEDDVIVAHSSCNFLRDHGFCVIEADCALAATAILDRLPYLSGLVADIDLGLGENGFDIARRTRAAYPGIPVVFVSGQAASRHATEGVAHSIFIQKPYHPRQVADALCALARPQAAA